MTVQLDLAYGAHPRHRFDLWSPVAELVDHERGAPFVVYVHGGGWLEGSKEHISDGSPIEVDRLRRALLEAGVAVVAPNYRLAGEAPHPAQVDDVRACLAHVIEYAADLGLDPSRVVISGESAGGHIAGCIALIQHVDLVGAVLWYPVTDLAVLVADRVSQGCPPGDAGPESPEGILLGGIDPALPERRDEALAASPVALAHPEAPPTMLLHGTADCLVPAAQSERLAAALSAVGVEVELVLAEGLDHADLGFMAQENLGPAVEFITARLRADATT